MFAPVTIIDSDGNTLFEVRKDGTTIINGNIEIKGMIEMVGKDKEPAAE
jgi:hypothetical protein